MAVLVGRFLDGDGVERFGLVVDDGAVDLSGSPVGSVAALLSWSKADALGQVDRARRVGRRRAVSRWLAPIDRQEVWAAGVTYRRSRDARMQESSQASVYDLVYTAARPEIFLKATPHRVVGPGDALYLRGDARWNVPEPEIGLVMNRAGEIVGYTIGNDLSSRDIEGENPLYLPQAKLWDKSCALGPVIALDDGSFDATHATISVTITRQGQVVFAGSTSTDQIVRPYAELAEYLYRDNRLPDGSFLLTGTGIVPPDDFTLEVGDAVDIAIPGIGALANSIRRHGA